MMQVVDRVWDVRWQPRVSRCWSRREEWPTIKDILSVQRGRRKASLTCHCGRGCEQ